MVLHPDVQAKAQEEIDRLCLERLPNFDDQDDLPYVEAIVREALRWNPVLPECAIDCYFLTPIVDGGIIQLSLTQ